MATKDSETGKIRPCIVVTNDIYNERVQVIQVVPVTEWSEKKAQIKTNVDLFRKHERTGRPMGEESFLDKLECYLDRTLKPQKPGPKCRDSSD
jgi:hypothetical protein